MKYSTLRTSDYLDAALIESYSDLDSQIGVLSYIAACIVDGNTQYAVEKLNQLIARGKQIAEPKEVEDICPKCASVMTGFGDIYNCLNCGMSMIKSFRANQHSSRNEL